MQRNRASTTMSFQANPAAFALLAITLAMSLAGLYVNSGIVERNLFRPYWLRRRGEWYTAVTSGFVHGDMGHLLFNMITFFFFAFPLERRLGTAAFLALYLTGLLASHAGTFLKHRNDPRYASLGASGAISAVLFAFIVYFPTQSIFIMPLPVPIPAPLFAIAYMAYSWYSARRAVGRINHDAHLWGALSGLVFVAIVDPGAWQRLPGLLG
jgi:membrane associated rhomboid family serine protease